jgi:hypothetical protein
MKVQWFSTLSIAGIILLAGNVFGEDLRWKNQENAVLQIPAFGNWGTTIVPVQGIEPIQPLPPMLQGQNPPPGATRNPAPVNVPNNTATPTEEKGITVCGDKITLKSIRDISPDIRLAEGSKLPDECEIDDSPYVSRNFSQSCFQWKASALSTKGAYFEDVQLERYGHSRCPALQPITSGARFFATIPMLPYKMGVMPPNECVYTLGHYRTGNCSPYMKEPFPISPRALINHTGTTGGAAAIVP